MTNNNEKVSEHRKGAHEKQLRARVQKHTHKHTVDTFMKKRSGGSREAKKWFYGNDKAKSILPNIYVMLLK